MAFTRIQGNAADGGGASATSIAVTISAVTDGNLIIGSVSFDLGGGSTVVNSVTDNASGGTNTYALETQINDATTNEGGIAFHCANSHGSPTTITANLSGSAVARVIVAEEFSGNIQQNDGRDGAAHGGQFQAAPGSGSDGITSGTFTTTNDGDLIWGVTMDYDGAGLVDAAGSSFTLGTSHANNAGGTADHDTEYRTQTTASSGTAATFTAATVHRRATFMIAIKAGTVVTPTTAGFFVEDTTLQRLPQNMRMMRPDPQFATVAQPLPIMTPVLWTPTAAGVIKVRMVPN